MSEGPVEAAQYVMELKRRAERAERERDALRADNDRLREALRQIRDNPFVERWAQMRARAALSVDAEPPCDKGGDRG